MRDFRRQIRKMDGLRKADSDLYLSIKRIMYYNNCTLQLAARLLVYKMQKRNEDYVGPLITLLQHYYIKLKTK